MASVSTRSYASMSSATKYRLNTISTDSASDSVPGAMAFTPKATMISGLILIRK